MVESSGFSPGLSAEPCHPFELLTDEEVIMSIDDSDLLIEMGECEFQRGDLDNSRIAFVKATYEDPYNVDAWHGILKLFFHSGRFTINLDEARLATKRLREAAPNDPLGMCMEAVFLKADGRQPEADNLFATALNEHVPYSSSSSVTPLCLGFYLMFSDKNEEKKMALNFFEESIALEPRSSAPWRYMGNVYEDLEYCEPAVSSLVTSINLYPYSANAWRILGEVYLFNCEGLEFLGELAILNAANLSSASAHDMYNLAVISERNGDISMAEDFYKQAVQRDPEDIGYLERLVMFYLENGRYQEGTAFVSNVVEMSETAEKAYDFLKGVIEQIYYNIFEKVSGLGWTYACEKDVVSEWKEIVDLSSLILNLSENEPYALYLRGRSEWRLSFCDDKTALSCTDQAIIDLNNAVSLAASCGETFNKKAINERGLAYMRKSGILFVAGDVAGASQYAALAKKDFETVIGAGLIGNAATIAAREIVEASLSFGWLHYYNGEYEKAKKYFTDISNERLWPAPPTSTKERIESYRALGLISYRAAKQMFDKAKKSGSEGDYTAAIKEFETSLGYFDLAVKKENKAPKDLIGTANKEGKNEIEIKLLTSLDNYLSEVFDYERLDTIMNRGFAEYFMGRALKEKPNPDTVKGNVHFNKAIQQFDDVLDIAKENSEMFRFRGSARIAKGEYNSGVDDILTAVRLGTSLKDNALSKIVLATTELVELTDSSSYTDYDSPAKRMFRTLKNDTDICGNRLKDEVLDLGKRLSGHKKRCNAEFFDDLYACIEKYGPDGRRAVRSIVKGCSK